MSRRLAVVTGALSLVALGAALGITIDRLFLAPTAPAHDVFELHARALEQFRTHLDLDDEQVAAIDSIFRHRQAAVENTWEVLHDHLHSAVDSVHQDVMAILRPDQRAALQRWMRRSGVDHDAGHGGR